MRVKGGIVTRRRHKRLLKLAEGFRGRRKNCFKIAKLAVQKALQHAYVGRKLKKRDMRRLWNVRINAACRSVGLTYSKLIHLLKDNNIILNRKVLAYLAAEYPNEFQNFLKEIQPASAL
ncbi:MAG: 50S ribosomal protein L20 [Deltaproteobacteria bacterium]|nr:50S ribosomal protein L20 [Deltaproteobacteria bacterium]